MNQYTTIRWIFVSIDSCFLHMHDCPVVVLLLLFPSRMEVIVEALGEYVARSIIYNLIAIPTAADHVTFEIIILLTIFPFPRFNAVAFN